MFYKINNNDNFECNTIVSEELKNLINTIYLTIYNMLF